MRWEPPPVSLPTALPAARREMRHERTGYRPARFAGMHAEDRQDLAGYLSGTDDRRSQPYRTAMRNIQRWEKGRQPTPRQMNLVDRYFATKRHQRVNADFEGTVRVSTDSRWRVIYGIVVRESDLETPAEFQDAFLGTYGIDGAEIIDVGLLEFRRLS